MGMRNTTFTYQYRDANNFKQTQRVTFVGTPDPELIELAEENLDESIYFIPWQVGLEDLQARFGEITDEDHPWHESSEGPFGNFADSFVVTDRAATDYRDINEFLNALAVTVWDETFDTADTYV